MCGFHLQDFARLQDAFVYNDESGTGKLRVADVRTTCRAFKVPLPEDVLQILIKK